MRDPAAFGVYVGRAAPFDFSYDNRLFGTITLSGVTVAARESGVFQGEAQGARVGPLSAGALGFRISRPRELVELELTDAAAQRPWLTLSYAAAGAAGLWVFSLPHQPLMPLAERAGWSLSEAFARASAHVSLTMASPADQQAPLRGRVELVVDRFPKPPWDDSALWFGDSASFAARVEPEPGRWALRDAQLSFSLFTLKGDGFIAAAEPLLLTLDARGALTCAQLRANLASSQTRDVIDRYLNAHTGHEREQVEMRLQLGIGANGDRRGHAAWSLSAGCGLTERAAQ